MKSALPPKLKSCLEALLENKLALIDARRSGDDDQAKRLSQERQKLKRGWCHRCGEPSGGHHCNVCRQRINSRVAVAGQAPVALLGAPARIAPADAWILLPARELDVLKSIATSQTMHQIGRRWKRSHKTVEYFRSSLIRRLGIGRRDIPSLVRYAIEAGIVT